MKISTYTLEVSRQLVCLVRTKALYQSRLHMKYPATPSTLVSADQSIPSPNPPFPLSVLSLHASHTLWRQPAQHTSRAVEEAVDTLGVLFYIFLLTVSMSASQSHPEAHAPFHSTKCHTAGTAMSQWAKQKLKDGGVTVVRGESITPKLLMKAHCHSFILYPLCTFFLYFSLSCTSASTKDLPAC